MRRKKSFMEPICTGTRSSKQTNIWVSKMYDSPWGPLFCQCFQGPFQSAVYLVLNFKRRKDRTIFIQTVINRLISANLKTCRPVVRPKHCRNRLHRATVHRNWQHRQFGVDSHDGRMFGGSKGREICRLLRF